MLGVGAGASRIGKIYTSLFTHHAARYDEEVSARRCVARGRAPALGVERCSMV